MFRRLFIALPLLSSCSLLFVPSAGAELDGGPLDAAVLDAEIRLVDAASDAGPGEPICSEGECQLVVYVTSPLSDAYQSMPMNGQDETTIIDDSPALPLFPSAAGTANVVGLRFENLRIPNGTVINRAEFEYTAFGSVDEQASWGVRMDMSVNAADFSTSLIGRSTEVCGSTNGLKTWEDGDNYIVPVSCQERLQELVVDDKWDPESNAVVILVQHFQGEKREAYSYEGALASDDLSLAPRLLVSFQDPGP
tara:strand:- start:24983 stop:25735 length:753 start_codon:yes stop_codon:yes gene_type:complete